MSRFVYSTGILSPINSDISLDDTSALSYSNLSGIADFEKEIVESPNYESTAKVSNIDSFCKRTMKESTAAFDVIINDIKKQSNINAEKEERFKESYEMLKSSMDEVFCTISHPFLSPISSYTDLDENQAESIPADRKIDKIKDISQIQSGKKIELGVINRQKKGIEKSKNICQSKESKEDGKQHKNKRLTGIDVDRHDSLCGLQKPEISKMVSSSTQTCEDFEAVGSTKENLLNFYSQKLEKAAVSNSMPAYENKSLPIEKSIQIIIGIEMDNLRRFMLDQNLCFRKEILKLQETAKKQNEVTDYLFSVIERLIEENKKLVSKSN